MMKNKRNQKIMITSAIVIIALVAYLVWPKSTPYEAHLFIELTSDTIKDDVEVETQFILGSHIEVVADENEVADVMLIVNQPTEVSHTLKVGTYSLNMVSTPIEVDGSTYKIPETIETIDVKESKDTRIDVVIPLERIDVEDMTQEQIDVVIERVENEAPDQYDTLVKDLESRKEKAESDETSVEDIQKDPVEETPQDAPKDVSKDKPVTDTKPKPNPTPKPQPKPNPTPDTKPKHTHEWVAQYKHHPATKEQGYYKTTPAVTKDVYFFNFGDGHKIEQTKALEKHPYYADWYSATHDTNWWETKEKVVVTPEKKTWIQTAPAKPAWDELTGYKCKCGATKKK